MVMSDSKLLKKLNLEWWHTSCGGFAGVSQNQIRRHLKKCYEKGRSIHAHAKNRKGGYTIELRFSRKWT